MRYLFGQGTNDVTPIGATRLDTPRPLAAGAAGATLADVRRVVRRPLGVEVSVFGAAAAERLFREGARCSLTAEEVMPQGDWPRGPP